jgi:plastocyanin
MRKFPAFALITAIVVLGLTACGGSSSSSSSSTSSAASSAPSSSATATASSTATATASSTAAAGASSSLSIAASPSGMLMFTKNTLTAKAGKITITFTNDSPLGHNFTLQQGTSGAVIAATPTFQGGTKTLTVDLKAGTYTYYCSVPGHRAAGMHGTLTVQ